MLIKIGLLAKQTGITVRTLHHYDEIGLLNPSQRSYAGHRLYTQEDVERLQQIVSLRQLGLPLHEIQTMLNRDECTPQSVIEKQIYKLEESIQQETKLLEQLKSIHRRLNENKKISSGDWINCIKETVMFEKYYSKEQMDYLEERGKAVGEERMQKAQVEWKELMDNVQKAKEQGLDPTEEPMLSYARKWQSLIDEFTGGDKGIEQSLSNLYQNEPQVYEERGYNMDPGMMEYVGKAIAALK